MRSSSTRQRHMKGFFLIDGKGIHNIGMRLEHSLSSYPHVIARSRRKVTFRRIFQMMMSTFKLRCHRSMVRQAFCAFHVAFYGGIKLDPK